MENQIRFVGASGKHYLSNPMGVKKYGFTTYSNSDYRLENWIGLTTESEAYKDAKDVPLWAETWEIVSPDGKLVIQCNQAGEYQDGNLTDTIQELIKKHGFDLVNAKKCITTN